MSVFSSALISLGTLVVGGGLGKLIEIYAMKKYGPFGPKRKKKFTHNCETGYPMVYNGIGTYNDFNLMP